MNLYYEFYLCTWTNCHFILVSTMSEMRWNLSLYLYVNSKPFGLPILCRNFLHGTRGYVMCFLLSRLLLFTQSLRASAPVLYLKIWLFWFLMLSRSKYLHTIYATSTSWKNRPFHSTKNALQLIKYFWVVQLVLIPLILLLWINAHKLAEIPEPEIIWDSAPANILATKSSFYFFIILLHRLTRCWIMPT